MISKKTKQNKGQHEIVGFVLIVVIVSIIGVIFLSFSIGKEDRKQESIEVSNLLQSAMYYTTDCAINYIPNYKEGQDLIKECYENPDEKCLNEENVCEALDSNLKRLIEEGLRVGEDSKNKAYKLDIYYQISETEQREDILYSENGIFSNCSSIPGGSHSISASRFGYGTINIELEVCRG